MVNYKLDRDRISILRTLLVFLVIAISARSVFAAGSTDSLPILPLILATLAVVMLIAKKQTIYLLPILLLLVSGSARADFGCCTHPIDDYSSFVCIGTQDSSCCGSDPSNSEFDACNTTFAFNFADCFNPANPVIDCLVGSGCCVGDNGCADTQFKAQCDTDTYYANTQCSDVEDCDQVCCLWADDPTPTQRYCDFVPRVVCQTLNTTSGFPQQYEDFVWLSTRDDITTSLQCNSECYNIDVTPGDIDGYVFDAGTGSGLEGVRVYNGRDEVFTDVAGHYLIEDSYSGGVYLDIWKVGYETLHDSFALPPGGIVYRNYTINSTGTGSVEGTIEISSGGFAAGATVILSGTNNWYYQDSILSIDSNGHYSFPEVESGHDYIVTAYMLGVTDCQANETPIFTLDPFENETQNLVLYCGVGDNEIVVRVHNPDGSIINDFDGSIELSNVYTGWNTVLTASNGYANQLNKGDGTYQAQAISLPTNFTSSISQSVIPDNLSGSTLFIDIVVVNSSEINGQYECVNQLGGQGCCLSDQCTQSLGFSSDCESGASEVCCAVPCSMMLLDTDGDGTPDLNEPYCRFEPAITDDSARLASEEGYCNDFIDNDCDSTAYLGPGTVNTNREDGTDSDCQFCTQQCISDDTTGTWCNETDQTFNTYTLSNPDEQSAYCELCPGDSDVCGVNQCLAEGHACCSSNCGGGDIAHLSIYDGDCGSGNICCSFPTDGSPVCLQPGAGYYECSEYSWNCYGGFYAFPVNTPDVCEGETPYACDTSIGPVQPVPICKNNMRIGSTDDNLYNPNVDEYREPEGEIFGAPTIPVNATVCDCAGTHYQNKAGEDPDMGFCCVDSTVTPAVQYYSVDECPILPKGSLEINIYEVDEDHPYGDEYGPYFVGENILVRFFQHGFLVNTMTCPGPANSPCTLDNVPAGTYNLSVFYPGEPSFVSDSYLLPDNQLTNIAVADLGTANTNAWLAPGIDCELGPDPEDFVIQNIRGTTGFNFSWFTKCDSNTISHITVGSNNPLHKYTISSSNFEKNCTLTPESGDGFRKICVVEDVEGAIHPDFEWNTTYDFEVKISYFSGATGVATGSKSTGDPLCEGQFAAEYSFCLDATHLINQAPPELVAKAWCDADNLVDESRTLDCAEDEICFGPDENHYTYCINPDDCAIVSSYGGEQGPFLVGAFQNQTECLYSEFTPEPVSRYCYWDYSRTVVDECLDCSQELDCFDYTSKSACELDNCLARNNPNPALEGNCSWLSTWDEFGKGICYRENYEASDKCSLCNVSSDFFVNPECTQDVCSKLGACFSAVESTPPHDGELFCASCEDTEDLSCESYLDEQACTGEQEQPFTLNNATCPSSFTFSGDSCSLGFCVWDGSNCFRDTDNSGKNDCLKLSQGGDLSDDALGFSADDCRKDDFMPFSTITSMDIADDIRINNGSTVIEFSVDDGPNPHISGPSTHLRASLRWAVVNESCAGDCDCINWSNATRVGASSVFQLDLPLDYYEAFDTLDIPQGDAFVYYSATDDWGTPEMVKQRFVTIDTIPPIVSNISIKVTNRSDDEYSSKVKVSFDTNELANCTYTEITGSYQESSEPHPFPNAYSLHHEEIFDKVYDGNWQLKIKCYDDFNNKALNYSYFVVNRLGILYDLSPDVFYIYPEDERLNNVYPGPTMDFSLKTPNVLGTPQGCNIYPGADATVMQSIYQDNLGDGLADVMQYIAHYGFTFKPMVQGASQPTGGFEYFLNSMDISAYPENSYHWAIMCYNPSNNFPNDARFGEFVFTYDNSAPRTTLQFRDESTSIFKWKPIEDAGWLQQVTLRFNCSDLPVTQDYPFAAGCAGISYCHSASNCPPSDDVSNLDQFFFDTVGQRICWNSTDNLGHNDFPPYQCAQIKLDQSIPEVNVTWPPSPYVTGNDSIQVNGTWFDTLTNATPPSVIMDLSDNTFASGTVLENLGYCPGGFCGKFFSGESGMPIPVPNLNEGANYLRANVSDQAKNTGFYDFVVYYDDTPPDFNMGSDFSLKDSSGASILYNYVEYGTPIHAQFHINDPDYTAITTQENKVNIILTRNGALFNPDNTYPFWHELGPNVTDYNYSILPEINSSGHYNYPVGNYTLRFSYYDKFLNCPGTYPTCFFEQPYFRIEDHTNPTGVIEINNTSLDHPGWLLEKEKTYYVTINYSEPLANKTPAIWGSWDDSDSCGTVWSFKFPLENVEQSEPGVYTASFTLPPNPALESCLNGVDDGRLHFKSVGNDALDVNGLPVVVEYAHAWEDKYRIDLEGAGTIDFESPVKNGQTKYVNTINTTLVGFSDVDKTPDRLVEVFMLKNASNTMLDEYWVLPGVTFDQNASAISARDNPLITTPVANVMEDQAKDMSWVVIDQSNMDAINGIAFDTPRDTLEFYTITSITDLPPSVYYQLNFTPALEYPVSVGDKLDLYNYSKPTGWFGMNFSLNMGDGSYHFYGYGTDDHGISSEHPGFVRLYLDTRAPVLKTESPANNSVTSHTNTSIIISFVDTASMVNGKFANGSGIDLEKVKMTITTEDPSDHNGTYYCGTGASSIRCEETVTGNNAVTGDREVTFIYDYADHGELNYTKYLVNISAMDRAGNYRELVYNFEIRTFVPGVPTLILDSGYQYDVEGTQKWFVNQTHGFNGNLTYLNDEYVNLSDLVLLNPQYNMNREPSYERDSNNSFNLSYDQPWTVNGNFLDQEMRIYAKKRINATDWGYNGMSTKFVVVDLIKPEFTINNLVKVTPPPPPPETLSFIATNTQLFDIGGSLDEPNMDSQTTAYCPDANCMRVSYYDGSVYSPYSAYSDAVVTPDLWTTEILLQDAYPEQRSIDLNISSCDKSGNCKLDLLELRYDTVEPIIDSVNATVPYATWVKANSVTFNWTTPNDFTLIKMYGVFRDDVADTTQLESNVTEYTWEDLESDEHVFEIQAMDNALNLGPKSEYTIYIDNTAPVLEVLSVSPSPTNNAFTVVFTATDEHVGTTQNHTVFYGDGFATEYCDFVSSVGSEYTFSCAVPSVFSDRNEVMNLTATAYDGVGNYGEISSSVFIDTLAPSIDIIIYPQSGTTSSTFDVNMTLSENSTCRWSTNKTALWSDMNSFTPIFDLELSTTMNFVAEGKTTFYIVCQDVLGNIMPQDNITVSYDETPPYLNVTSFGPVYYHDAYGWYTNSDKVWVAGISEFLATVNVSVGGVQEASEFIDDSISPTINLAGPFTFESSPSGLLNFPVGTQVDFFNNLGALVYLNSDVPGYELISMSPNTATIVPLNTVGTFNFFVNGTPNDPYGNLDIVVTDHHAYFNFTDLPLSHLMNGIDVVASDPLGNLATWPTFNINLDTDAPIIDEQEPAPDDYDNVFAIPITFRVRDLVSKINWETFNMTVKTSQGNSYTCVGDLTEFNPMICSNGGRMNFTDYSEGFVKFWTANGWLNTSVSYFMTVNATVNVKDNIGQLASSSWQFTLDDDSATPPEVFVDDKLCNITVYTSNSTPQVHVEFAQDVKIINFAIDGVLHTLESSDNKNWYYYVSSSLSSGNHNITVSADKIDGSGNVIGRTGQWTGYDFFVDADAPQIYDINVKKTDVAKAILDNGTFAWLTNDMTLNVTFNWFDNYSVDFELLGGKHTLYDSLDPIVDSTYSTLVNLSTGDGIKTLTIKLTDLAGTITEKNFTILLDTTAPARPKLVALPWAKTNKANVTVVGWLVDDDSYYLFLKSSNLTWSWSDEVPGSEIVSGDELLKANVGIVNEDPGQPSDLSYVRVYNDSYVCSDFTNNYAQFGSNYVAPYPRQKITDCVGELGGLVVKLKLDSPRPESLSSIFVFTKPRPNRYFNQTVSLGHGLNWITAQTYDRLNNTLSPNEWQTIERDDSLALTLTLKSPLGGAVLKDDFVASNSYKIEVETNYDAICTLSHGGDMVSESYVMNMQYSGNHKTHSITFNSDQCKEEGDGTYCMIGGNQTYPRYYEHFEIECEAEELDLTATLSPCIKIATYVVAWPDIYGENICGGSGSCGPIGQTQTECKTCENFGTQDECSSNGCMWCDSAAQCLSSCDNCDESMEYTGDNICDTSCDDITNSNDCTDTEYCMLCPDPNGNSCGAPDSCANGECAGYPNVFEPNDYVCDPACSTFNSDQSNCVGTGYCSWCESDDGSTSCVDSCNGNCADKPEDYTGDAICDASCSDILDTDDCQATGVCTWCGETNTCGDSCASCGLHNQLYPFPVGDRVCDFSCDVWGDNESECSSTYYCMWCDTAGTCLNACNGNDCPLEPSDYGDDFVCDIACQDQPTIYDCTSTNYCYSCGTDLCVDNCDGTPGCSAYPYYYGADWICKAAPSGGSHGILD